MYPTSPASQALRCGGSSAAFVMRCRPAAGPCSWEARRCGLTP